MSTTPNSHGHGHASGVCNARAGFTLLEIMLAVAVLGLVAVSIYRFVETTITAVQTSQAEFRDRAVSESFTTFLRAEMERLPPQLAAITGEPHVFNNVPWDELRWIANPGFGTMTRHAIGEYQITLTVQEPDGGGPLELGLRRQPLDGSQEATWFPLIKNVKGFEVRYFDSRGQQWMEKWTDLTIRPSLIRVKLWRGLSPDPQEIVLPIPFAATAVQMPTLQFGAGGTAGSGRRRGRRGQNSDGGPPNERQRNPGDFRNPGGPNGPGQGRRPPGFDRQNQPPQRPFPGNRPPR